MKKIELYHGSDARIIEMTKDEREQYKNDCNIVVDYLFPLFKPLMTWEKVETILNGEKIYYYEIPLKLRYQNLLNEKGGQGMYFNLSEKLMMIDARNNGSELYQYNDLYFCSSKLSATNYARSSFAGGETGLNAYRLIQGAEIIGFENMYADPNVKRAAERIKEFAKEGNERPVIITIEDIDPAFLFFEDGRPLDKDDIEDLIERGRICRFNLRYTKYVELKTGKIEFLNKELYNKIPEEEQSES